METTDKKHNAECSGCMLAGLCHTSADIAEVPDAMRWRAIFLALVIPLVLVVGSLFVMISLGASEGGAAIISIALPIVYYLSFYIFYKIKRKKTCLPQ